MFSALSLPPMNIWRGVSLQLEVGGRYLGMGFLRIEGVRKIVKSGDLICSDLAADTDGIRTFVSVISGHFRSFLEVRKKTSGIF